MKKNTFLKKQQPPEPIHLMTEVTSILDSICKGNTLTMYASFNTSKNGVLNSQNKKAYIKYGKHTFKLTSKTKYYFSGDEGPDEYCSKSAFMSTMRSMNGLGLCIKVTNGKVVEMSFRS